MAQPSQEPIGTSSRPWFVVGRLQEFDGEVRANQLRIFCIAAFYLIELLNYYGLHAGPIQFEPGVDRQFHITVSGLAAAWVMVAFGTFYCLRIRFFPAALKYITTASDIVILTTILTVADGPRSPLVVGYFLVISAAALRMQLALVWCATLGTIAGHLFLLGFAKWHDTWLGLPHRDLIVPRYAQLIMLLALAVNGIMVGQIVRRVKAVANDYARRLGTSTHEKIDGE